MGFQFRAFLLSLFNVVLSLFLPVLFMAGGWVSGWTCGVIFPETTTAALAWAELPLSMAQAGAIFGWVSGYFPRLIPIPVGE